MTKKILLAISIFLILSLSFTLCSANELTTDMKDLGEKTKNATMGITNDVKNSTENMVNDTKKSMDNMNNKTKQMIEDDSETMEQGTRRK